MLVHGLGHWGPGDPYSHLQYHECETGELDELKNNFANHTVIKPLSTASKMDFQAYPRNMGNKSSHALKLQQHLYDQMSSQTEFCDVTLMVGDIEVKAHWNVLVSCPYFQSLYDSGMDEKVSGKVILHIGKLAAIRSAIAFLYVGTVEISYENVRDLLEVAEYFQISDLKQACRDYLFSVEVTVDNCVQICLLCSQYDLDIYNKTYDFLRGHLPEVMKKDDILTLTHDSILAFIMDQTLSYIPRKNSLIL
ncbi:unnamed protein product [Mytilus edulis]|uniref:BTB domain-containing protein n=1 Tax=Mytilus edulis TaxID=6550 RepID=A0A8S3TSI1_MYTED|nr:unnamed protein product [Mytilus edulis]